MPTKRMPPPTREQRAVQTLSTDREPIVILAGEKRMSDLEKNKTPWQQTTGALFFLCALFALVLVWCWVMSWPRAVSGHDGAIENLLTSFWVAAFGVSVLAAGFKRSRILLLGASAWSIAFYLSSLFLGDMVRGHNVGVAIRIGALSALSFVLSGAYLGRGALAK